MNDGARPFSGWPIALALVAVAAWLLSALGRADPVLGLPEAQATLDVVTTIAGGIAAGALICHLALRALGEVAVLGIRPGLMEADRRAAD